LLISFVAGLIFVGAFLELTELTTGRSYLGFIVTMGVGTLLGMSELLARYKDEPGRALTTWGGFGYMSLNGVAAVVALIVLLVWKPEWLFGDAIPKCPPGEALCPRSITDLAVWLKAVAVAGLGSAAIFRASFLKIKTADGETRIGPDVILDTLLATTDRQVDRAMAGPRGERIAKVMEDISFARAKDVLPTLCFALMQNVNPDESQRVSTQINALEVAKTIPDRVKAYALGLHLMNVVGHDVLSLAVARTKDLMWPDHAKAGPAAQLLDKLKTIPPESLIQVVFPYALTFRPDLKGEQRLELFGRLEKVLKENWPIVVKSLVIGSYLVGEIGVQPVEIAVDHVLSHLGTAPAPPPGNSVDQLTAPADPK